jgi:group I intron endonuclease
VISQKIISTSAGVYAIINIRSEKLYIGSTQNLSVRFRNHRALLVGNRHSNKKLQRAWNKHGKDDFVFIILEYCPLVERIDREQYYIDLYKSVQLGYNITEKANCTVGYRHLEKTKKLLSQKAKSKEYFFYSPSGKLHSGKNLQEFCRINNLCPSLMGQLLSGRVKYSQGWIRGARGDKDLTQDEYIKITNAIQLSKRKKKFKKWRFIRNGEFIEIDDLKTFCKQNKLNYNSMYFVYHNQNRYKSHCGYVSGK